MDGVMDFQRATNAIPIIPKPAFRPILVAFSLRERSREAIVSVYKQFPGVSTSSGRQTGKTPSPLRDNRRKSRLARLLHVAVRYCGLLSRIPRHA